MTQLSQLKNAYVVLKLARELKDELKTFKKELGFKTMQELVRYLVLFAKEKKILAIASYKNVFIRTGNRPVIITGPSGSGKTTAIQNLLAELERINPTTRNAKVFILDVSNEYEGVDKIDLGQFFSLNFSKPFAVRFVPDARLELSKAQAAMVFGHLNFLKTSGQLKEAIIIVEEAHRFSDDHNLRALLIEARKFIAKLILVTTDWQVYQDIAPVFRPEPWQYKNNQGEAENTLHSQTASPKKEERQ